MTSTALKAAGACALSLALLTGCNNAQSQNYTTETTSDSAAASAAEKTDSAATATDAAGAVDTTAVFDDLSLTYPATWSKNVVSDDIWDVVSDADGALLRVAKVEAPAASDAADAAKALLAACGKAATTTVGEPSLLDSAGATTVATATVEAETQDGAVRGTLAAVANSEGLYLVSCTVPADKYDELSGTVDAAIASIAVDEPDATSAAPEAADKYEDGNFVVGCGLNAGTYTIAAEQDDRDGGYMLFENVCAPAAFLTDSGTGTRTIDLTEGQFIALVDFSATL